MIFSVRFLSGYASRFSVLGSKTYRFEPKLNVIIGPNGSGKTTLLDALAKAAGCGDGGWSDSGEAVPPFKMDLQRDEWPVFYQNCYADSEESFINPLFFQEKKLLRSTGEKRIGLINELLTSLENRFLTYKLKPVQRPTLILDEVDNHIGFVGQAIFWKDIVPRIIKKYQLIVSTHSIFPLLLQKDTQFRKDNIITLYRNYDYSCIASLKYAIDFYNSDSGSRVRHRHEERPDSRTGPDEG
ncbi:MAG: AAA family ATPase [Spirochaetales bacterium]|nr:AAA family ATPase [Spirochaetales bacterium]